MIAVVEDNPTDVFLVREALTAHNLDLRMELCEDGEEAIEMIARTEKDDVAQRPELILEHPVAQRFRAAEDRTELVGGEETVFV